MTHILRHNRLKHALAALFCGIALFGCDKYLDGTPLPAGTVEAGDMFVNDDMASAAVTGILLKLTIEPGFNGSAGQHLGPTLGLYADELKSTLSGNFADILYKNAIQPNDSKHWAAGYRLLFVANAAISGINRSEGRLLYKNQWLGEAHFLRALFHFNLVNLYGPVPIVLTTDYSVNNRLSRSPVPDVYKQIVADLRLAQTLLPENYANGYGAAATSRVRPNKGAATALLARVYLYMEEWEKAETEADAVIADNRYDTVALNGVFLANSKETIWAIALNAPAPAFDFLFYNNGMPSAITPPQTPATFKVYAAASGQLLNAFEPGDKRFSEWLRATTILASGSNPEQVEYFPAKIRSAANNTEMQVPLRLAEQYLIRAEARAMQGKSGAADDLNVIRRRAGLAAIHPGTKTALLAAIARERQTELFCEFGHRFFDLKRTGKIDEVMNAVAPTKPATWQSYMANWPIPPNDILSNPNITPNPGYVQ